MYVAGIFFIIYAFSTTNHAINNTNGNKSWSDIKRDVLTKDLPLTLAGTALLFISVGFIILQDPSRTMYALLALCCLAVGLAYGALVISIVT